MTIIKSYLRILPIALMIISAIGMFSCKKKITPAEIDKETLITHITEGLTTISSSEGRLSYRFETPLMERYELASEPYIEFTKGVKVETFSDSVTMEVETRLTADYAKRIEPLELWEARGNVVAVNLKEDRTLKTEQLFWDEKEDRIYSNVHTTILDGTDLIWGEGFESKSDLSYYEFRRPRGQITVDTTTNNHPEEDNGQDSLPLPVVDSLPGHSLQPVADSLSVAVRNDTVR